MSLGYRTILSAAPTSENFNAILGAFERWVTRKKLFDSLPDTGTIESRDGARLTAKTVSRSEQVNFAAKRWTLIEEWDAPAWYKNTDTPRTGVTTVTLALSERQLWLWVDVEPPTLTYQDRNGRDIDEVQNSGRPTFVSAILDAVEMHDGVAEPLSDFQIIASPTHIEHLAQVLADEDRIGAVLVTAPPADTDVAAWADLSTKRVGQIQGMGIGYALSAEAREVFNNRFGAAGHWVPPGGMRTFLPGARLGATEDAFNHRLLAPSTLRDSSENRIRRILRNAQLKRLSALRIPDALREVDYDFLRQERLRPFTELHSAATTDDATESDTIARLRALLEEAETAALEAFDENKHEKDRADAALDIAQGLEVESNANYSTMTTLRVERNELRARLEMLQRKLEELGEEGALAAWSFPDTNPLDKYPTTFAELLKRVDDLDGVDFTGDAEEARALDEHPGLGETVVMRTWDALVTFDSYAAARRDHGFDQSLSHYVTHSTHGHRVQIGKVTWTESEAVKTRDKFRTERTFRVHENVDESGYKFMVAHVRLSNLTGVAPRLYFEDTYSDVGYVTVGYLGAHLSNTLTN